MSEFKSNKEHIHPATQQNHQGIGLLGHIVFLPQILSIIPSRRKDNNSLSFPLRNKLFVHKERKGSLFRVRLTHIHKIVNSGRGTPSLSWSEIKFHRDHHQRRYYYSHRYTYLRRRSYIRRGWITNGPFQEQLEQCAAGVEVWWEIFYFFKYKCQIYIWGRQIISNFQIDLNEVKIFCKTTNRSGRKSCNFNKIYTWLAILLVL